MISLFTPARWIHSPAIGGPRTTSPCPYFRKTFTLHKAVREAHLHITALGLYEAEVNGQRVGDQVLAPGWTDYKVRVPFQTLDVTPLLKVGENVLGIILADGWYAGYVAWLSRQQYGDRPMFLAALTITFEDGTQTHIYSDSGWKTQTGPILASDLLQGESYDARLELGEWTTRGYDDSGWSPAIEASTPAIALVQSEAPPVRRIEELSPVQKTPKEAWPDWHDQFDFGQNFSGRIRIEVEGPRGTTITIKYAEILEPNGHLYTENLRSAAATDYYTLKGEGTEIYEPRFTFHGFRYVSISGLAKGKIHKITGIVLHSDTKPTGYFSCSHPLLNQLQHNIVWGQKSNFLEVPTDCPQRDERLGWTGDAQVFIRTACFNMDVRGFFHKWMQDIRDAQHPTGAVPPVIPNLAMGMDDGGPAWADATVICPWTIYLCYGDTRILSDHYDSMARYLNYLAEHRCKDFIRSHPEVDSWGGFGDWLALDGSGKTEGGTPRDLIGTAFYAYDAELMAKIARVLGKESDAAAYEALHANIVKAFQDRFTTKGGLMSAGTQTAYVLALHFRLMPQEGRATAIKELVRNIEKNGFHLATGFVGTPYLLDVLEDNGHLDLAYKLLEQETFPSWLFPIKNGATTIWERWDGWTPEKGFQTKGMNSFNHYAYGAVGAWMYRTVAGLDLDPADPGYGTIVFRPRPGGTITHAEAELETPQGKARIRWKLIDGALDLELTVPGNSKGRFSAPAGFALECGELPPGSHKLTARAA